MTGVVNEKDERAYMAPDVTIFIAPLDNSPEPSLFFNTSFPLLSARLHSFDIFLHIGQIICFICIMNLLMAPLLVGLYAVEFLLLEQQLIYGRSYFL